MIEVDSLWKSYVTLQGRRTVFRDLTFNVPAGVNVAVLGRNGAGKSTLLRLLAGVDVPDRGLIRGPDRLSWPVGLSGGFSATATARESLRFLCRIYGVRGAGMRRVEDFVQDFADIGDWFDLPIKTYSSGMRARVAFGASMAFKFDYYLIDEVMSVGDPQFRAKCNQVFKERLKESRLILVSHSARLVKQLCQAVVHLENGRATVFENVDAGIEAYQGPMVQRPMAQHRRNVSELI